MHAAAVILLLLPLMVLLPGPQVAQAGTPAGGPPLAFVANSNTGDLEVLNAQTNQFVATVTALSLGGPATAVAITPDGRFALVTVGFAIGRFGSPSQVSSSPSGFTGVVAIDTASLQVAGQVTTTASASRIAIAPDGKTAYVQQTSFSPSVTPIDVAESPPSASPPSVSLTARSPVNPGFQVMYDEAVSPDGGTLYLVGQTRVTPVVTNTASPPTAIGGAISDSATLSNAYYPSGTISFSVFGPHDPTCTGTALTSTVRVFGDGSYSSSPVTPTALGTYNFVASYSGDANNNAVTTACGSPNSTTTVNAAVPAVSTTASPAAVVGGAISDSATLSGGFNPTGTLTFQVFGPNDPTCSALPAFTTTANVTGNATYSSGPVTPAAVGTYNFVVSYSGDGFNQPAVSPCGASGESTTVAVAVPRISTRASASVVIGGTVSDTATLSGGFNPTGIITFRAFTNDVCKGTPAFTSTATVSGNGTYTSGPLTPATAGFYEFIASYSGDGNNAPVAERCGNLDEITSVRRATPVVTTTAATSLTRTIYDTATLTVGFDPTGTIVFNAYGPNDPTCTATPAFTSTATVTGDGTYLSSQFTPPVGIGQATYNFVASYSGDINNQAVTTNCGDPNESVTGLFAAPALQPRKPAATAPPAPVPAAQSPPAVAAAAPTFAPILEALPLPLGTGPGVTLTVPNGSSQVVISPDGSTAYLTVPIQYVNGVNQPGFVEKIGLSPTLTDEGSIPAPGTPRGCQNTNFYSCPNPVGEAIATTPQGSSSLWVAANMTSTTGTVFEIPLPGTPGTTPVVSVTVGASSDFPISLAASPDGASLEASAMLISYQAAGVSYQAGVAQINLNTDTLDPCVAANPCPPPGGGDIAITPDQRPVAAFTGTPGLAGQPSSFDASSSTVAYNQIASYAWDFGDGTAAVVTGTVVTHTYAVAGTYTVSLTETSEAGATVGTSPPSTVFTGKTMTRRGGPPAFTSQQITITAPLPSLSPSPPVSPSPSVSLSPSPPVSPSPSVSLSPSPLVSPSPSVSPNPSISPNPALNPSPSPTVTATLTLDPTVGTLGTVVAATGAGFPANAIVTLTWSAGIGHVATVLTDANGGFVQRILILPNDKVGYRFLMTSNPTLQAQFLVEPLSLDPGGKDPLLFHH
jgi:hypothetical protein